MLKKSFLLCLFVVISFILMSFNYQTFNLSYDNNTLYYGDNSYKLKEENYITLINDDGNNQEYLIIMGDIKLFFDSADENYYYFAGYNNEEILTLRVDISKGRYIIDMCLCNKVNKENNNYLDYYLIRDKYYELRKANTISIKRSSTPYINPYTLEQMTSSDRYLDGYEPTKYSVLIDTRYEDPIVNIIPKELFFTEGKYVYYGEEYIFAINTTYETHTDNVNYYASRVVVFDIDITDPRNSMAITSNDVGIESGFTYIDGYNIFIDMPVMEVYVGIVNNNSKFQSSYHVDDSQDKVVIEQGAFLAGYGIDQSPLPIYMDLEYMTGYVDGADDNYIDELLSYDSIFYNMENNSNDDIYGNGDIKNSIGEFIIDFIVSYGIDKLIQLAKLPASISNPVSIILNLLYSGAKIIAEYNAKESDEKLLDRSSDDVIKRLYTFNEGLVGDGQIQSAYFLALPESYKNLIDNQSFAYSYSIGIHHNIQSTLLNDVSNKYLYTNCVENIGFKGTLYDYLGNDLDYIRLGGINGNYYVNDDYNDNEFMYQKIYSYYAFISKQNITLDISSGYSKTFNVQFKNEYIIDRIKSTKNVNITFNVAINSELHIVDIYGRVIATNRNGYFNSNKCNVNLKSNENYLLVLHFIDNNQTGNISISKYTPINLTSNYTYTNNNENVLVFKLGSSTSPRTYNFFTNSYQDTRILIYGENGNIKGYNDDAYYDPDSDEQDYNAAITYHVNRNEVIYIFVYANGDTPYNKSITFNAYLT